MTGEYDGCCCNQLDPPFTAARGSSWTTRVMMTERSTTPPATRGSAVSRRRRLAVNISPIECTAPPPPERPMEIVGIRSSRPANGVRLLRAMSGP